MPLIMTQTTGTRPRRFGVAVNAVICLCLAVVALIVAFWLFRSGETARPGAPAPESARSYEEPRPATSAPERPSAVSAPARTTSQPAPVHITEVARRSPDLIERVEAQTEILRREARNNTDGNSGLTPPDEAIEQMAHEGREVF